MINTGVLHLTSAKSWRGGEQQVLYLALALAEQGIRQCIVAPPGSQLAVRAREKGLDVWELRIRGEVDIFAARRIREFALQNGFGLLHAHTARAHSIGLLARRKSDKLRLIVSRRVDFPARPNFLSRMKYESPFVDRYIAISRNVARILVSDGIPADRISVAYSGIDSQRFKKLPSSQSLRTEFNLGDAMILGNVAALVDHKDHRTLLEAAGVLLELTERSSGPEKNWKLVIVGEGPLHGFLLSLVQDLDLEERVVFTGFRQDVPAFLDLFDLFIMSSKEEGLGTAVLDAMAAGLPVVATAGGGIPEMVDHKKGGLLSPVGGPRLLAENLYQMMSKSSLRQRYGRYNRRRVKDFDFRATAEQNLAVYQMVLAQPAKATH
ncbi:MAG: glycosyltransferase [Leptospiraceae bacterium]|nr:glycosyltransferase [Leptospiraceae bacterium]MCB1303449.1 glycosyltransferase [Leptospiraceae bacterium]